MNTSFLSLLPAIGLTLAAGCLTPPVTSSRSASELRAHQVITVTDDFIVDVYHNGVRVEDGKRQLLLEHFGATAESLALDVRKGDWLVFHVVNNRLRWDGAYYFGAAGIIAPNEFGFVSELASGVWSVCDHPAYANRFIAENSFMSDNRAVAVARPWHEGTELMKRYAGESWCGEPIWGRERSTWLKVRVP